MNKLTSVVKDTKDDGWDIIYPRLMLNTTTRSIYLMTDSINGVVVNSQRGGPLGEKVRFHSKLIPFNGEVILSHN